MIYKRFRKIMAITLAAGLVAVTACGSKEGNDSLKTADGGEIDAEQESGGEDAVSINPDDMFTDRDISGEYDDNVSDVTLSDGGCRAEDDSVTIDGDTVTFTGAGTFIISGSLSNGMLIVDAGDSDKVQLVLEGVDITSETSAPIYVKNAKKVFVTLAAGTENILSNGGSYEQIDDNNIDAVIFAKEDLTLNGEGSLTINATTGHGVVSKDDIAVTSGTYTVTSDSHSFDGKNSVRIAGGAFNLKTGKDGIHSENADDVALGFIYVSGGDFNIAAGSDGMSAATELRIDGGNINVTESDEGLEGKDVIINEGNIQIVAADDGINASDGSSSGDMGNPDRGRREAEDGEKSGDGDMPEAGDVPERGEMSEDTDMKKDRPERPDGTMPPDFKKRGERPDMSEGEEFDKASEGMNGKRMGGPGGGGFDVQDASIVINGGTITIDAEGDGIDSNGTLTVNGGTVYIAGPTRSGNGALDYGSDALITGGTVIAAGDRGMAESFGEESTQAYAMVSVEDQADGGDIILKDMSGNELVSWTTTKRFNSVVISCPQMQSGEKYTLVTGENSTEVSIE